MLVSRMEKISDMPVIKVVEVVLSKLNIKGMDVYNSSMIIKHKLKGELSIFQKGEWLHFGTLFKGRNFKTFMKRVIKFFNESIEEQFKKELDEIIDNINSKFTVGNIHNRSMYDIRTKGTKSLSVTIRGLVKVRTDFKCIYIKYTDLCSPELLTSLVDDFCEKFGKYVKKQRNSSIPNMHFMELSNPEAIFS